MKTINRLKSGLGRYLRAFDHSQREKAAELTAYELRELENIFVLLLTGSLAGLPAPPPGVSIELLPCLEHELEVLNKRAAESPDALAELLGTLDID